MLARNMALLGTTFVIAVGVAQAQSPQPDAVQSAPETKRTTETRRTTEKADRTDISDQIGWELAEGDDGVRVERIVTDSPIAQARLEENDVIKSIGGVNVRTPDRIQEILSSAAEADETELEIVVIRDGQELSYLLPLESVTATRSRDTQTTTRGDQGNLVQMIRQLQAESQQQQALLQTLLTEIQNLRAQLEGAPGTQINNATTVPPDRQSTGNTVAPRSGAAAPNAAGGRPQ